MAEKRDLFDKRMSPGELRDEEYRKLKFVEEKLAPMIREATGGAVFSCEYMRSAYGPYEAVSMMMIVPGEVKTVAEFRADVTADSPWAIAKDVMAAVARWYE